MKHFVLLLFMLSFGGHAATSADCELVNGIYKNSTTPIRDIKFETVVDVFTIRNANAMSMTLDDKNLRFVRSSLDVGRQTKMIYLLKKKNTIVRAVHLMIDRDPREVTRKKEFYGNMIISPEMTEATDVTSLSQKDNLVYNFYCRF